MVYECRQAVSIPIIGMGGIMDARDALEFMIAGATAVQVGTANFVDPLLWQEHDRRHCRTTCAVTGSNARSTSSARWTWGHTDARRHGRNHFRLRLPASAMGSERPTTDRARTMKSLLVALDVDTVDDARRLADTLRGTVGGFKIGSRLFTAHGPAFVQELVSRGDRVFLDLKFHDIPNTVAGAVAAATRLGVWMVNVHAGGGLDMMRAARQAADDEAGKATTAPPLVIAVTVLTSFSQDDCRPSVSRVPFPTRCERLALLAQSAALDGVVASPQEIGLIREACDPRFDDRHTGHPRSRRCEGRSDAHGICRRRACSWGELHRGWKTNHRRRRPASGSGPDRGRVRDDVGQTEVRRLRTW